MININVKMYSHINMFFVSMWIKRIISKLENKFDSLQALWQPQPWKKDSLEDHRTEVFDHRSGSIWIVRSGSVWIAGLHSLWVLRVGPDLEFWLAARFVYLSFGSHNLSRRKRGPATDQTGPKFVHLYRTRHTLSWDSMITTSMGPLKSSYPYNCKGWQYMPSQLNPEKVV